MDSAGYRAYSSWLSYRTLHISTILENLQVSASLIYKTVAKQTEGGWIPGWVNSWLDSNIGVVLENLQMAQQRNLIVYMGTILENPGVMNHLFLKGSLQVIWQPFFQIINRLTHWVFAIKNHYSKDLGALEKFLFPLIHISDCSDPDPWCAHSLRGWHLATWTGLRRRLHA